MFPWRPASPWSAHCQASLRRQRPLPTPEPPLIFDRRSALSPDEAHRPITAGTYRVIVSAGRPRSVFFGGHERSPRVSGSGRTLKPAAPEAKLRAGGAPDHNFADPPPPYLSPQRPWRRPLHEEIIAAIANRETHVVIARVPLLERLPMAALAAVGAENTALAHHAAVT